MDRYRLLSIIIVPRVTHAMGIMSGFILMVVMVVMAVRVADCTVSMIIVVENGKLKSRLKWSWPNRGYYPGICMEELKKHEKSCQVSRRPVEIHTRDTEHNPIDLM